MLSWLFLGTRHAGTRQKQLMKRLRNPSTWQHKRYGAVSCTVNGILNVRRGRRHGRVKRRDMAAIVRDDARSVKEFERGQIREVGGRLGIFLGKILCLLAAVRLAVVVFDLQLQYHLNDRFLIDMAEKKRRA